MTPLHMLLFFAIVTGNMAGVHCMMIYVGSSLRGVATDSTAHIPVECECAQHSTDCAALPAKCYED